MLQLLKLFFLHLLLAAISVVEVWCDTTENPYAQVGVLNKLKNLNGKVFALMSGVSETKFLGQHQSFECK